MTTHGNSVGIKIGDVGLCGCYFPDSSLDADVYAEEVHFLPGEDSCPQKTQEIEEEENMDSSEN